MPATRSPTGQYVRTRRPRAASACWRSSPRPRRTWNSTSPSGAPMRRGSPPRRGRPSAGCATRSPGGRRRARLEQAARQRLEVAVGLGLDLEDRRLPAVLARLDDLVVPVGALDEPDDERVRAPASRAHATIRVAELGRVAQVGLEHEPGRRAVAELVLGEQLEHEVGDRLARVEGLHVDVQVRADLAGVAQQLAQARRGVALAALRRVRAQQRGERARPSPRGSRAGSRRRSRPRAAAGRAGGGRPRAGRRAPRGSAPRSGRPRRR